MNKLLEPLNSTLINEYTKYDIRFTQLALYVKDWNKRMMKRNERDPLSGFNSYTLTLMIIAFL
jgi:DNA polymerase sigma